MGKGDKRKSETDKSEKGSGNKLGNGESRKTPSDKGASKKSALKKAASDEAKRGRDMQGIMALDLPFAERTPAVEAYFQKCTDKIGFIPNVLLAYAHDMGKLDAFTAFYNDLMLAPSGLTKLDREMIAVVVSSQNHCYYCLTAHGAAVRQLSGRAELGEQMVMNYRVADLEPRQRAMLDFAVQITLAPDTIEETDRQYLRDVGFSERDIWDIAAVASFFNMTNRMASAVDMRPNAEYHAQGR